MGLGRLRSTNKAQYSQPKSVRSGQALLCARFLRRRMVEAHGGQSRLGGRVCLNWMACCMRRICCTYFVFCMQCCAYVGVSVFFFFFFFLSSSDCTVVVKHKHPQKQECKLADGRRHCASMLSALGQSIHAQAGRLAVPVQVTCAGYLHLRYATARTRVPYAVRSTRVHEWISPSCRACD